MLNENSIIIGIAKKDKELIIAEWDEKDKRYSGNGYREIVTETHGEEEARKRLSDSDYWKELGYLNGDLLPVLENNIDFDSVAEDVINSDGWQMTNGEFYEFGEYDGETVYTNFGSGWSRHEKQTKKDFIKMFITPQELKLIQANKKIENKQDRNKIIKELIEELDFDFNREY